MAAREIKIAVRRKNIRDQRKNIPDRRKELAGERENVREYSGSAAGPGIGSLDLGWAMRIVGSTPRDQVETQPCEGPPVSLANAQDVGALLREARERHGVSLDRLAQITRIRASLLRAIESNDIDHIPQAIFLRGYLRAYAREIGLDPEETVRCYLDQFAPAEATVENQTPPVQNAVDGIAPEVIWRALRNVAGLVVIAVIVILYGIGSRQPEPAVPGAGPAATAPAAPARQEVGTTGSGASAPVAAAGHVIHVALRANGDCWVSAKVDGAQVVYKLLHAGDARTFDVKGEAVLHLGDPAAASLSIDGVAARPLGAAAVPVTLHITKDNFRSYLQR